MASKKSSAKPSFYEVVFRGKPKVVRGFLHGLTLGANPDAQVFFSFTDGINHEGKVERFVEKVGLRNPEVHVVVDAETSRIIKSLAKRIVQQTGLEIVTHRRVKSARLPFRFHAYTPKLDDEILALVKKIPAGVKLKDFRHNVTSDPASKGVEAYAPAHDYEATGEGELVGPVDLLVDLRRKMHDIPLIEDQDIELTLA